MELLQRSRSVADADAPAQRAKLLPPLSPIGIVLAVVTLLLLIFPKQTLIEKLAQQQTGNPLTASYIDNLLRAEPDNDNLRLMLARQHTLLGKWGEARQALAQLRHSKHPEIRQRAGMLAFRILGTEMRAFAENTPRRALAQQTLRQELKALATLDWDETTLQELAREAVSLGESAVAVGLYRRIAGGGGALPHHWFAEAARIALGSGDYRVAAELYFSAQDKAQTRAMRREYFLLGLKTLQSGNLAGAALAAAQTRQDEFGNDEDMLIFLTNLARAANDLPRAEGYVRRLLRIAARSTPLFAWLARLSLVPAAWAEDKPAQAGMRPFDETIYLLAYEVFLGNRKLDDAYRVANAAVASRPDDAAWRERLAQAAEWSNHPTEALHHWYWLAQRKNSEAAWQAVLRLAPGLNEPAPVIAAWKRQAEIRGLTPEQWDKLIDMHENQGDPEGIIAYLGQRYEKNRDPFLLGRLAALFERSGHIDQALQAYQTLVERHGAGIDEIVRYAGLLLVKGQFQQAYDELLRQGNRAGDNLDYWNMLSELAWQLQQDDAALQAYRSLTRQKNAPAHLFERLVALLRERAPEEAALLAEEAGNRLAAPALYVIATEIWSESKSIPGLRALFGRIPPEMLEKLESVDYFLELRAQHHLSMGDNRAALADYRRVLKLKPDNRSARISRLWILVELRDLKELRRLLPAIEKLAQGGDAEYAKIATAAYIIVGEPEKSLPHFARLLPDNHKDYLWLLNYADALELAKREIPSLRLRRAAWLGLRRDLAKTPANAVSNQKMIAAARLITRFEPGDPSVKILRRLLRQDKLVTQDAQAVQIAPEDVALNAQERELVLGWLVSTEQNEAARAWLWRRYGAQLAAPQWSKIPLALDEDDMYRVDYLMRGDTRDVPPYNRIEATHRLRQVRKAQSLVFDTQEKMPDDDEVHRALVEQMLAPAWRLAPEFGVYRRGAIRGESTQFTLGWSLRPNLLVEHVFGRNSQKSSDNNVIRNVPSQDTIFATRLRYLYSGEAEAELLLGQRRALSDFDYWRAAWSGALVPRVQGSLAFSHNDRATESSILALGAVKDQVEAGATYALSKREYLSSRLWQGDFYSQQRTYLGRGEGIDWEAGYRIRTEYPDLRLRLNGAAQRYNHSGDVDEMLTRLLPALPPTENPDANTGAILPQNFTRYGISAGFGDHYRTQYTRGAKLFCDAGLSHNSVTGLGHDIVFGIAGSMAGNDHLSLTALNSKGKGGTNDTTNELWLRYQLFD